MNLWSSEKWQQLGLEKLGWRGEKMIDFINIVGLISGKFLIISL